MTEIESTGMQVHGKGREGIAQRTPRENSAIEIAQRCRFRNLAMSKEGTI